MSIGSVEQNGHTPLSHKYTNGLTQNGKPSWGGIGQKSFVALLLIANLAASCVVGFLILINLAYTRTLSQKPPGALVQLSDGTSIAVEEKPSYDRDPAVIRKFVSDSLIYLMNWSSDLPNSDPVSRFDTSSSAPKDQGVAIKIANGFSKRVTTPAWQASYTLEETFRTEFLQKLAQMTPQEIFTGHKEVVLKLRNISEPTPLPDKQGSWTVDVVADLMVYSQENPQGKGVSFNKRVYVRSIDVPSPPDANNLSSLAAAIYAVRLSGLEITGMRDIQLQEFAQ